MSTKKVILTVKDLLAAFNLSQFVTQPTHSSGNTLDLLITSEPNTQYFDETRMGFHISDHARKDVHFRNMKSIIDQSAIEDYAKDGGKELFTKMHGVLITNPE